MPLVPGLLRSAAPGLLALTLLAPPAHGAATLYASSGGADSAACGSKASPCRSISQAIANAAAGDTILVGPGRYGDLDEDAVLGGPGEETGGGGGCGCLIEVTKPVRIVSRDGFGATLIQATAFSPLVEVVASGVTFGERKRGFALRGQATILEVGPGAAGARIGGNLLLSDAGDTLLLASTGASVTRNVLLAQSYGILSSGTGNTLEGNIAIRGLGIHAGIGDRVAGNLVIASDSAAFTGEGGVRYEGNVALGNLVGMVLDSGDVATGNAAHGNGIGVEIQDGDVVFTRNALLANTETGLFVPGSNGVLAAGNSLFGNGAVDDGVAAEMNCGAVVESSTGVDLSGSFWGSPVGPGFEPADQLCVPAGEPPQVEPVAAGEIKVRPKIAR